MKNISLHKNLRYHLCSGILLIMLVISTRCISFGQAPQLKFLHLNTEHGLPDGSVRSVTQDKYGYIWLGTQFGLCRYNGYDFTKYFYERNDSTSLGGNFIWSTFTDQAGDVWVGNDGFLSKYFYGSNHFKNYNIPFNALISKIMEDEDGIFWLATSRGLMQFDKQSAKFTHYNEHADSLLKITCSLRMNDLYLDKEKGLIYLASHAGLKIFDYHNQKVIPITGKNANDSQLNDMITVVTKDKTGSVWLGCGFNRVSVARWDTDENTVEYYNDFSNKSRGWSENRILSIYTDREGRIWVGGFTSSLSLYLPGKNIFHHYQNDALLKSSIAGTSIINIYQDRSGMIWVGSEVYGVERFQPDNILFTTFQPQASVHPSLLHDWGRAAFEDSQRNIWFGTAKGISLYNPETSGYKNYFNDENNASLLSFNTIRSFAEDREGNIWIGTGNWLNRYDPGTGKFRIYNNSDSLKSYFIWSLLMRHNGKLYVGGTGGLQVYDRDADLFRPADENTVIQKKFLRNIITMFEDSQHGLWIGFYNGGLMYYHPERKITRQYVNDKQNQNSLSDNFVTSIVEDHEGLIWVSTRDGLNSFDPLTEKFRLYTTREGLPSNKTSALRVDDSNQIWIGTGNGLSVLDPERKFFRNFDISDGLPTLEFNEQIAATTQDGRFIYPTFRGFIMFSPDEVQRKSIPATTVYASGIQVLNKPFPLDTNIEEIKTIKLRPHQNIFSIELTGLNFENPNKVFYAYKLELFNEDWVVTRERNITYTNLSGGDYTFYYKATTDPSNWDIPVHELNIQIARVFYKTTWFLLLVITTIALMLFSIYRFRLRQTRNVHQLQLQATRLEKDKTEIQYQNLINQFNPHFLFNSLTSLNSLIYENKELASEFLEQLSAVYRYLLTHKESQLVTLEEEAEFVRQYASLLKTRFEKGLVVDINIPSHLQQKKIVPVTFQILIENALKHNIVDEASPLNISFTVDDLYLNVTNNLQQKGFVETSNRKGLESLQTLYKYLSSLPFIVEQNANEFIIRIPLL